MAYYIQKCYFRSYSTGGFAARIDPNNTPFLHDEQIDGISLEDDYEFVRELQVRLGRFNHGALNFFPVNWPASSNSRNIKLLETQPFVVSPTPVGTRFLLYIDQKGRIFMENMAQHIFKVDQDKAPWMTSTDTVLDGIVTRMVIRDGSIQNKGKLTFVIMDVTRVNGVDLTKKGILERMSAAQVIK